MEKMSGHTRLYRRDSTYYHRAAVPNDLLATYGKIEEKFSLRTKDYAEALRLVKIAAVKVDELFHKGLPEGDDPMDYTWMEAGRLLKGDHSSDYEMGCMDEDPMVQVWADRLTRTFGKEAWRAPLVFLQALERYSPKMTADLKDYLTDHDEEF